MCSVGGGDIGATICILGSYVYGTVAAASLIVSGSIVIIGNTVHWIEKKGRCSEDELKTASQSFTTKMEKLGGKQVTKVEQLNK